MEIFDFIKILFENPKEYTKIKRYEKAKFYFITSRFMSIMYPIQANMFNVVGIDGPGVLDYWHENMSRLYKKVPSWIYVKTAKKKKEEKLRMPSVEATKMYLNNLDMSLKDLKQAVKFFGEDALTPIRQLDEIFKNSDK
jgi:hypothetical protein